MTLVLRVNGRVGSMAQVRVCIRVMIRNGIYLGFLLDNRVTVKDWARVRFRINVRVGL